jgi:hypothetical protein
MNKKILIIIIIAILILLVGAYLLAMPSKETRICKAVDKDLKNTLLALKTSDISYCDKTGNPEFCKARITKDAAYCDSEQTKENKNYCLAVITNNEDLCAPEDWWCKADASRDVKYCDYLPEGPEQNQCIADTTLDETYYEQKSCN